MSSFIDLTGMKFGNVLVNSRAPNKRKNERLTFVMWNCTCLLCGKQFVSKANNLRSGNTTSCGCTNKQCVSKAQLHDLTGQQFGYWYVLKRAEDKISKSGRRKTAWTCKCNCGSVKDVLADKLINGESKSCGCYKRKLASKTYTEDLTGQRFNHLLVLQRVENVDNGIHVAWLCRCDCGNEVIVRSASLKTKTTQSCGCLKFSINSEKISNLLKQNKINYQTEYKFKDLYRYKGHFLRFDFALFDSLNNLKCLIEYQGQQHYKETFFENFGKEQREVTDQMKRNYCIRNNIMLFEIKYNDDIEKEINKIIELMNLKQDNPVPSSK